jgi:hypothetical protein
MAQQGIYRQIYELQARIEKELERELYESETSKRGVAYVSPGV